MVKKVGKYELYRTLGEGTFGKVKYAINTEIGEAVAIKVLDKEKIQKQNMGAQIKKEISIMKMVRHKYVVGMKEVLASRTKIFIVLELVTGGELFDKIVSEGKFPEEMARFYFHQLVEGVEYCHGLGVCHRDLKPENLLLDENGNLKISDFGLSALYVGDPDAEGTSRQELLHTTCGTPNYVAPEVLADKGYDGKKADVWSIGVILYVLLAGFLPFDESTIVALFAKIQAAHFTYPSWFTPEVRALLDKVLVADPKERVSLSQLKKDPWYTHDDGDRAYRPTPSSKPITTGVGEDEEDDADDAPSNSAPKESKVPSKRQMPKVPTEAQIQAAVPHAVQDTQEEGGEDSDGEDASPRGDDRTIAERTGGKKLNAFDLVNQCGGFALDRLFRPRADKAAKRTFQYTSRTEPHQLLEEVTSALTSMGFQLNVQASSLKAKAEFLSAKGMIGLSVQILILLSAPEAPLCLLEIRRGKGDIMEFHNTLGDLHKRIEHLVNAPPASG